MPKACVSYLDSFPSREESRVIPQQKLQVLSMKVVNLAYSLAHAFGAAFDNPDLLVTCVVGDGEAETGGSLHHGTKISF